MCRPPSVCWRFTFQETEVRDVTRGTTRLPHSTRRQTASRLDAARSCLPTVCWPFHPVLICEKQCQACVASCLVEILCVQPSRGLREGTFSPQRSHTCYKNGTFSFSLEAKITPKNNFLLIWWIMFISCSVKQVSDNLWRIIIQLNWRKCEIVSL